METETKALGKKVEERNNILNKLHTHYDASIHSMAHLKEKRNVMNHVVEVQTELLTRLQHEKSKLRQYITEMKREHNRARREIQQMSFQSGLLDKPNLMVDYDRTVEMASQLKIINGALKQTIERMTHKIALLEERCTPKNLPQE
ncbi:hypothetical protein DOY81_014786 [Sarcophaga bullata]|nr:hypothetical protein DOY81_014786 [Sarcophaga bullata]